MNKQSKIIICTASLALLVATAFAQSTSERSSKPNSSSTYQSSSSRQGVQSEQQFFQARNFLGEKVKNTQNQNLGTLKDIVFNPQNGQFFAAIDIGGSRYALVPWQALNITSTGKIMKKSL